MEQYVVSARKYRPNDFSTLIGQDSISTTLVNSIKRGQVSHSYLFCGPRGVGKTTTARIFAKMLNCEHPSENLEPCGQCESCLSFAENRSFCIHELDAASNNSVEDIKSLLDKVLLPPTIGKYSVYIIDEVHMLSTAAFNAFLKTLEEPPAHAIFILATTEKHKIPATILSRCQTYDFNRISIDGIVKNITDIAAKEGITIDEESKHVIARKADGAMRDALTIFDQCAAFCGNNITYDQVIQNLNFLDYGYSFKFTDFFLSGNYRDAFLMFNDILAKGFSAVMFVSALTEHFRNLSIAKAGGADALLEVPSSVRAQYHEQCARCDMRFIFEALKVTNECEAAYRSSINPRLLIEFALMKLCYIVNTPAATIPVQQQVPQSAPVPQATAQQPAASQSVPQAAAPASQAVPQADAPQSPAQQPAPQAPASAQPLSSAPADPQPAAPAPLPQASIPQAAPAEQPSAPAETQPADAPRRKTRAERQAELSGAIQSLTVELPEQKAEQPVAVEQSTAETQKEAPAVSISEDQVAAAWHALCETCKSKAFIYSILTAKQPTFDFEEGGDVIVNFEVMNSAAEKWIYGEQRLEKLEKFLCKHLGYDLVHIRPRLTKIEAVDVKPYLPEAKARDLISKSDGAKQLVEALDLYVK